MCIRDSPYNVQGENLRWYVLPTGGMGTTYVPHPASELSGRYFYWVSQSINGCESELARISTTISETPVPEIGLVIPPSPCLKNGAIQLKNLVPNQSYILSFTVNSNPVRPALITATGTGTHIFTGLAAGSYTDIKVQSRGCQSDGLEQELIDNAFFSVEFTGTPSICKEEVGELVLNLSLIHI